MSAREITVGEVAEVLELEGPHAIQRARRILRDCGIARQHRPRGRVFTTLGDLQGSPLAHVWAQLVTQGVADE